MPNFPDLNLLQIFHSSVASTKLQEPSHDTILDLKTCRQKAKMSFETPLPPFNATDPYATFLSSSCLDFLLIEIVPMAHRIAEELAAQDDGSEPEDEQKEAVSRRLDTLGYRVGQGMAER